MELAYLYRSADVVVQPSLYEGFGYPVAEAMSCGAAVIAADSAALLEVGGDAVQFVPTSDAAALADAMLQVASDRRLRARLQDRSLERATFLRNSSSSMGEQLAALFRSAVKEDDSEKIHQRVAIWSSMPPLDCGVADYSAELSLGLGEKVDVEVRSEREV